MSQSTYYQKPGSNKNLNQPQKNNNASKSGSKSAASHPTYYQRSGSKENPNLSRATNNSSKNNIWNKMPKWVKIGTCVLGGLLVIGIASGGSDDTKKESEPTVIETEAADTGFEVNEVNEDSSEASERSIVEEKKEEDEKKAIEEKKLEEERAAAEAKKAEEAQKAKEEQESLEAKKAEEERLALEAQKAEEEKRIAEEAATQKATEEVAAAPETADVQSNTKQADSSNVVKGTESPNALMVIQMGPTTGGQCWVPRYGGKKYHSNSSCSGMDDPILTTVDTATACGFDACKKCH